MHNTDNKDQFNRRDFLKGSSAAALIAAVGGAPLVAVAAAGTNDEQQHAGSPNSAHAKTGAFPRVWISSRSADSKYFADLAAHGAQVIQSNDFRNARKHGLQTFFSGGRIRTQDLPQMGLTPEYAVAIAGTYNDLSIDSHAFPFTRTQHTIEIGLPVFYAPYDWKTKQYHTGNLTFGEHFGAGYFSTDRAFKAEVIVKERDYDGRQHLAIIPAAITGRNGQSVRIEFDLSKVEGDLEQTMLAVYWRTQQLSPCAASTRAGMAQSARATLERFARENGGSFPHDVVRAMRFGDECFLMTSFAHSPKCSLPLYDYSDSGLEAYRRLNGTDEYPRVWGYPEVFGVNAYRDWLYAFHRSTAELVKTVVNEVHKIGPGVLVFRNPTRFNPTTHATLPNDHDGCSTQLLAEQLDMINADPYPVARTGDSQHTNSDRQAQWGYIESIIPMESGYWSGLVRRCGKRLVTWLQAHTFAQDLQHITPNDAQHIYRQAVRYNPDGIMWLGYSPGDKAEAPFLGMTLPDARPETWKALRNLNERAQRELGHAKKVPEIAVVRFYGERALVDLERRNLHDRFLTEQILTGLTMDLDVGYDVFEYYRRGDLKTEDLRGYRRVILCVRDLEGLPLDQMRGLPLSIVCWDGRSLGGHAEFSGARGLSRLEGERLEVEGPMGVKMPSGMAYGALLGADAERIATVGEDCCMWRQGNAIFASFLPQDPFDDGEYVLWLMGRNPL